MKYLGITSLGHDASVALVEDGEILFAGHAERYSRKKNDGKVNQYLLDDLMQYGYPDEIVWYEKPWLKKTRELYAGQLQLLGSNSMGIKAHLGEFGWGTMPVHTVRHHESHAAAGYFTSKFQD